MTCDVLGYKTFEDLMIMDMEEFGIILEKSWLFVDHANMDFYSKTITIAMPRMEKIE